MPNVPEPLTIGASDLLKGVEYTYCEWIHVRRNNKFFGKKWRPRYVIISKCCLYIYTERSAKKAEYSTSLKHFESAGECSPESGEDICFCLRYKNAETPLLFSCDTKERREKWVEHLCAAISEVQSLLNKVSADSAFGSAETIPNKYRAPPSKDDHQAYDEVKEWVFKDYKEKDTAYSVKTSDDDDDYILPDNISGSNSTSNLYENVAFCQKGTARPDLTQKVQKRGKQSHGFMDELKQKFDRTGNYAGSVSSASCVSSSYLSVHGAASTEESLPYLYVGREESLYANETDASNSSDSGNTSPVLYETPEKPKSNKPFKFKRKDYMCHAKGKATRELKHKPEGYFAVYTGESAELGLCVVTPHGLKHFRIHSHSDGVSLFDSHQNDTSRSLDELLAFYHNNTLPRNNYSVKLQRGYNTSY